MPFDAEPDDDNTPHWHKCGMCGGSGRIKVYRGLLEFSPNRMEVTSEPCWICRGVGWDDPK